MTGTWTVEVPHDHVVVTGGGSGIGRAVALALARGGVDITVMGRRGARLEETVDLARDLTGSIVPAVCDIRDPEAVDRAFDAIDARAPATGLVNAAAQVSMMAARDLSPGEFGSVVDATLLAAWNVVRRWARPLLDTDLGGSAVLVTSSNASMGAPGLAHSSAGKAATNALVKTLGREWGRAGITLNTVGPGPFPVEKSRDMWNDPGTKARMFREVALGRYGELHEIVAPIVFLLSAGGAFTTGQNLTVDGGLSLQHWPIPEDELDHGRSVWATTATTRS